MDYGSQEGMAETNRSPNHTPRTPTNPTLKYRKQDMHKCYATTCLRNQQVHACCWWSRPARLIKVWPSYWSKLAESQKFLKREM